MKVFLDDTKCREALFPFTLTRHVSDIRVGIYTIREKWEKLLGIEVITERVEREKASFTINANIIPTQQNIEFLIKASTDKISIMEIDGVKILNHPWQIFQYNDWALREDFKWIQTTGISAAISSTNTVINAQDIYIEADAQVEYSFLNAANGPIYIGHNSLVMEGNFIRGPFAMCDHAVLKMAGRMYGATTIGPHCIAAGEIKNSVMFGFSNKAHDGYLGDSVIGEWCNLGAGTSNSNLKNTAGTIQYFLNNNSEAIAAGSKGGLLMADYSRVAINTSFNTGTVVGVCCNIFGDISLRKYLPDFSWGHDRYIFEKALRDIAAWKEMKNQKLTDREISILRSVYER